MSSRRASTVATASRVAIAIAIAASPVACSHDGTQVPQPLPWSVRGGFLRDVDGRAVVLRGANLAGAHKHAPWFGFHQPADYARLRQAWGMNSVRFLTTWAAIEPNKGEYDAAYLDALALRMDWARAAGLLVVLDMHQDVYGEGFVAGGGDGAPLWTCDAAAYASFKPTTPWFFNNLSKEVTGCYDGFWNGDELRAHYTEAWRRVAQRLKPYTDVIIGFDPMNEPYWGSTEISHFEMEKLGPFYVDLVPKVRDVVPWVAFLEPSSARNLGGHTALEPFPFGDVVYSPHSYDRNAESGMGFPVANRDALVANVASLADEARALGAALWIGEYGGPTEDPAIVPYMTAQYDASGAVGAGAMYWAYDSGGSYSILDAAMNEKPALMSAIVRPYPERTAGDPISWSYDPATSTFTFSYHPNANVKAPTIVSVPDRLYPSGYSVDCGGCTYAKDAGRLTITAATGDVARVVLRP